MAIWSLRRTRSPGSPSDAAAFVTSCMEVPIGKRSQKARACISARYSTTSIPAMAAIGIATSTATHLDRRRMFNSRLRRRWRDSGVALAASLQRARDEPRVLHLLDELAKVARAERAAPGRAHCLLDHHETPVDHAQVRIDPRELDERLFHAGGGFELVLHQQLDRRGRAGRGPPLRALQRAGREGTPKGGTGARFAGRPPAEPPTRRARCASRWRGRRSPTPSLPRRTRAGTSRRPAARAACRSPAEPR